MKCFNKVFSIITGLLLIVVSTLALSPMGISALDNCSEEKLRDLGVSIVNCTGSNNCRVINDTSAPVGQLLNGSKIYLVGDSISVQSEVEIRETITAAPHSFVVSGFNADSGRALSTDTAGEPEAPSGIEAVQNDSTTIAGSDAVIVALGTNSINADGSPENLSVRIPEMISAIRASGFTKSIYWVNVFSNGASTPIRNAAINSSSIDQGYAVVDAFNAGIELDVDGVHPSIVGRKTFADTLLKGLQTQTGTGTLGPTNSSGVCACQAGVVTVGGLNSSITWGEGVWGANSGIYDSGLGGGPYTIEQWAIHVLKNISLKTGIPESQMVTQAKVISLIAWSRAEGGGINGHNGSFNPLNSKLAHGDLNSVNQGNATNDTNSQGYPDFDTGVEATTRALFNIYQKRIGSALLQPNLSDLDFIEAVAGDFAAVPFGSSNQSDVVNKLEDIYPGDRIFAALSVTGFVFDTSRRGQNGGIGDRALYVSIKQGTLENTKENYSRLAGQLLDSFGKQAPPAGTPESLVFSPDGASGAVYSGGECQQDGAGSVSTDGYAFPLAPQTKAVGGVTVGQADSTHHDNTAAFDLFSGSGGADVYSIYSGTPVTINKNFSKVAGCSSIQFQADDGYFYWYGHLKNVVVEEGFPIEAGVKMAEVADSSFGGACVGGGPHLHIDRGCTIDGIPQRGGGTHEFDDVPGIPNECRDPEFIPFLSRLYEALP